jgi:hypothetical protein
VVEIRDGRVAREARVIFDGINAWFVDDGERLELRAAEDRVVFVEAGTVERIGPGMVVSSAGWVKSALDGRRIANLEAATGEVLGRDDVDGRPCWVASVAGLRTNDDARFRLHVDAETGVILREAREDVGEVLRVEDLVLGDVRRPGG